jgi:neutral ceramidase
MHRLKELNPASYMIPDYISLCAGKKKTAFFGALFLFLLCLWLPGRASGGDFRAAVVKVDITPGEPQVLAGYDPRTSTGIHDRIFHRVVAMDDGTTQFFLISTEIVGMSPSMYDRVAAQLKQKHGINPQHLWWTVTHTHSAPKVGPPGLGCVFLPERCRNEAEPAYTTILEQKLIAAIVEARQKLAPARLGVGWGFSQANINRRAVDIDGQASLGLNPDGPVDRRIGLLRIDKTDGTPLALIANYPIHGTVLGGESTVISGDAPGVVAHYVEEKLGAPLLFINGAAGNLAPIYSVYSNPKAGHLMQFRVLLGDKILEANQKIASTAPQVTLTTGAMVVETPSKEGLTWSSDLASYTRTIAGGSRMVRLPVRFLKINHDVAIWSAPLELFVEVANEVRDRSPFPYTFYFGYSNGWLGYLLTESGWKQGGYETRVSPFTPSAAGDLTESVVSYLQSHTPDKTEQDGDTINRPRLVRAERDGVLRLQAVSARAIGPEIKYMPEWKAFGWFTAADRVEWEIETSRKGKYDVYLDWSVSDEEAGKSFVVEAGYQQLKGKVGKTGSWETYKMEKIGTIQLPAGRRKIVFKPGEKFDKGALLDLRELKLVPVQ